MAAVSSAGVPNESGTAPDVDPGVRPKRIRCNGAAFALREFAHQVTTWDWARVIAT